LISAYLRASHGISEILTTILLNYVAFYVVTHFCKGPWRSTDMIGMGAFRTDIIPFSLPRIFGDLHIGILVALVIVVVLEILMRRSVWGYEITSIGSNSTAASFAGIPVKKYMIQLMLLSGALAGLAGGIEVTGVVHRLTPSISINYAWSGLTVSILAGTSFLALIPYGIFMAVLLNGGVILKTAGLTYFVVFALTGLILVLAAVGEIAANYEFVKIKSAEINTPHQA